MREPSPESPGSCFVFALLESLISGRASRVAAIRHLFWTMARKLAACAPQTRDERRSVYRPVDGVFSIPDSCAPAPATGQGTLELPALSGTF
jgi:hypothetical protein